MLQQHGRLLVDAWIMVRGGIRPSVQDLERARDLCVIDMHNHFVNSNKEGGGKVHRACQDNEYQKQYRIIYDVSR